MMKKLASTVIAFFLLIACEKESKIEIVTTDAPKAIGPYSQGILIRNTLYSSGQIGINPKTGTLVEGGAIYEFHQIMQNHRAILLEAGMDSSNIVKVSIFMTDLSFYKQINDEYAKYFSDGMPPARETVEVSNLPAGASIEISLIAKK